MIWSKDIAGAAFVSVGASTFLCSSGNNKKSSHHCAASLALIRGSGRGQGGWVLLHLSLFLCSFIFAFLQIHRLSQLLLLSVFFMDAPFCSSFALPLLTVDVVSLLFCRIFYFPHHLRFAYVCSAAVSFLQEKLQLGIWLCFEAPFFPFSWFTVQFQVDGSAVLMWNDYVFSSFTHIISRFSLLLVCVCVRCTWKTMQVCFRVMFWINHFFFYSLQWSAVYFCFFLKASLDLWD